MEASRDDNQATMFLISNILQVEKRPKTNQDGIAVTNVHDFNNLNSSAPQNCVRPEKSLQIPITCEFQNQPQEAGLKIVFHILRILKITGASENIL